jgi:hypothetical protein
MYKICLKCKKNKPFEDFHRDNSKDDGLQIYCKDCRQSPSATYRKNLRLNKLKKCDHCKKIKPFDDFGFSSQCSDGHRSTCKECRKLQDKKHREANPGKEASRKKRWEAANPEKAKAVRRKWRVVNKERQNATGRKWRKNNRAKQLESERRLRVLYPDRFRAREAVADAIKHGKLLPVKFMICSHCKHRRAEHYHHHKGYDREHWLDVEPVCHICHTSIHRINSVPTIQ